MAQSTILLALPGAQKQRCATLEPRFDTIIKCLYHEKDQERPETHDHIGRPERSGCPETDSREDGDDPAEMPCLHHG